MIFLVDDDASHVEAIRRAFRQVRPDVVVLVASTLSEFCERVAGNPPELAILELNLPDGRAVDVLTSPPEAGSFPIIVMTGYGNEQIAVEALKAGALDFFVKTPEAFAGMPRTVERALREWSLLQERRQNQEALRRSEQRFRTVARLSSDFAYSCVPDSTGACTVDWITDAFYKLSGYSPAELTQHGCWFFVTHPEDRQAATEPLFRLRPGDADSREFRVVTKEGHVRWLANRMECEADPATPGGLRLYGAVQDVTARKESEAQFRQAQKMESIGRLASGVAHDFNNMLTVITCSSELALMELDRHDLVRVHLDEIGRAGKRAAALTRQLLTFSRKHLVQLEILDLTLVLADVEMMLRRLIGEHITVVLAPRGKPACVKADRGLIEQVIMNLAVNARDAMPNGGTLTFTIELVRLDADHRSLQLPVQPGSYVMLAVSDTGMGMTEATIERIFEPFFTTKGKDKGTGLGLATVYGIVRQSGGGIRVESSPGRGTRFTIYLPRVVESAQDEQTRQFPAPARGSETILVVEDEAPLRDLVRQMLEATGYHVLTCATGADALRLMRGDGHAADLLLTDVVMPGINGRELADQLVSLRPDLKVLYMSGYTDDAVVQRTVIEHTDGFIGKPFTLTTLTEKIRQTLGSTV